MELKTTIERVLFEKESGSGFWLILKTSQGIAKGTMSWIPKVSESIALTGEWSVYNGQKEFKFKFAMPDIPVNPRAMLHYVCNLCNGIGEKTEGKIWDKLGELWEDITVGDVKGMTEPKVQELQEKLEYVKIHSTQVKVISYLMSMGCTMVLAEKAWARWERETTGVVNENCFKLTELRQVGFCHIDNGIRKQLDIADNDPRRIRAGIRYAMQQVLSDGSTIAKWDVLSRQSINVLNVSYKIVCDTTREMIKDGEFIPFPKDEMLAEEKTFEYEKTIWEYCNG